MSIKSNEDYTDRCRLCLQASENFEYLFGLNSNLIETIKDLIGLDVSKNNNLRNLPVYKLKVPEDDIPSGICYGCRDNLNNLSEFKKKCMETNRILHEVEAFLEICSFDENESSDTEAISEQEDKLQKDSTDESLKGNQSHQKEHSKPSSRTLVCNICGKKYRRCDLKYHLNSHTGDRPCKCTQCSKDFPSPSQLRYHQKVYHSDEFKFTCDICGRAFKLKSTFNIHRSYHADPELPCPTCGKLLRNKRGLKKHMLIHTGQRPFTCLHCPKTFLTRYNWQLHQRVHTKERPFKCPVCEKSFNYKCGMTVHQKICSGKDVS